MKSTWVARSFGLRPPFALTDGAERRAASYLKGWVDTGMLTNYRIV
jgi:hypothetical protein